MGGESKKAKDLRKRAYRGARLFICAGCSYRKGAQLACVVAPMTQRQRLSNVSLLTSVHAGSSSPSHNGGFGAPLHKYPIKHRIEPRTPRGG